jgi:hypothetical protein
MVSVAVLAAPVLAPAVIVTAPDPLPLAGERVSHVESLAADQPHDAPLAAIATALLPPAAATPHDDEASA